MSWRATSCRFGRRTRRPRTSETFSLSGADAAMLRPWAAAPITGVSLTPVILRWNFLTSSRRFQPWFQGAGGLIYTTHKFPPTQLVPHGTPGGTSVWNFSPQGGGGIHYFIRPKRSIDLGVNGDAHLLGVAGRPQPRRERQHSGAGGLHLLEIAPGADGRNWTQGWSKDERTGSRVRSQLLRGHRCPAGRGHCGLRCAWTECTCWTGRWMRTTTARW